MQRPDEATDDNAKDSRALEVEYDTLEASIERIIADMGSAPLRLECSIGDISLPGRQTSVDDELPYSFNDDPARGSVQGNLATASSADGRTQDCARFCEQRQGNPQENGLSESNRDPGTSRQEAQQQHRSPIRGLVAVTPALHSHHQPDCAIAQGSTSSATPYSGTKAENGTPTHALTARALAPLPASSPLILKSQSESIEDLKPFPADSPLVLRSQPEE